MAAKPRRKLPGAASTGGRAVAKRASRKRATDLDLRRAPLQSRGQATFEHILDATAKLLDRLGLEGVNTNTIAKAAGVNIATLYQYFPNKQAVLLALFQRHLQRRAGTAHSLLDGIGSSTDWPERIDAFVDGMARLRADLPGAAELVQAMRVDPELRQHNLRAGDEVSAWFAEELVAAGRLSRDDARIVARCALEVNSTLMDIWQMAYGGRNPALLAELKQLLSRYLAPHLPAPVKRAARPRSAPRK